MKNKNKKNDNGYTKRMFDSWKNNDIIEENVNLIINDSSFTTYGMWLSIQNYDEKCSYINNTHKFNNKTDNNKTDNNKTDNNKINVSKIKIYTLGVFNNIFLNFNIRNFNIIKFNLINFYVKL